MTDDTRVREFLERMADEADVAPVDWRDPVKRARRRRSVSVVIVAIVVVALVSGVSVARHALPPFEPQPGDQQSAPPAMLHGSGSMVDIDDGTITPLPDSITSSFAAYYAVSPDHKKIAYSACCDSPVPLYVANLDGTSIRQVTPPGVDAFGAQWSPDGASLVYQQRDASTLELGNLFVLDVATGQQTQITDLDQSQLRNWWFMFPSFMPDRPYVLFHLPRGDDNDPVWNLWATPISGGESSLVRHGAGWGALSPGWPPGNRNLASLSAIGSYSFDGDELWLSSYDLRNVAPRSVVQGGGLSWVRWSPDGRRISYAQGQTIYVLDLATGTSTEIAPGTTAEWFDNHTLIVVDS